jgi:hypothetical protein
MRRRDVVKYAAVLVTVFGTIICAAEFQDTGAHPARTPARTITVIAPPSPFDTAAALERAREDASRAQHKVMDDASRAGTPWLAP